MQSCRIKINHIFSFTDDGSQMTLQKSNLMEHTEFMFNLCKKGMRDGLSCAEIAKTQILCWKVPIHYDGLNPCKAVEMFLKFRPVVPDKFNSDDLCTEPNADMWPKMRKGKID